MLCFVPGYSLPPCPCAFTGTHTTTQSSSSESWSDRNVICLQLHQLSELHKHKKKGTIVTLDLDRYNSPVFKLLSTSSLPLVAGIVFCKPHGSGSEWPLPLGQSLCEPVPSLGWRVSVELVVSLQDACTEGMEGLYSRNMGSNWHNVVKDPREKFWEG